MIVNASWISKILFATLSALFLGMLAKDEPYVVHTSVDYTNCLVPRLDLIVASPYYWGVMDRYEAEALLENKPEGNL